MGVRTLIGEYDGTTPAAAMVDSASGFMVGPLFEGSDAPDRIEGFVEWMRVYSFVKLSEEIGLEPADVPGPVVDIPTDPRAWPDSGMAKLVVYYDEHVWGS